MHPASFYSPLAYDFSFRNRCLMALSDLQPPHLLGASEPSTGGTRRNRAPAGASDANTILAALADMSTTVFSNLSELTITYLSAIQRLLGVRGALTTRLADDTITIVASSSAEWRLPSKDFPLEASFCQYVQTSDAPLIIADALCDERVANIAMRNDLGIRAYLGVPLYAGDGSFYGTICAVDPQPRTFNQTQIDLLRIIAGQMA